jgi:hypothetical protein
LAHISRSGGSKKSIGIIILVMVIISVFIIVMWGFIWRFDHTQEVVSKNKYCKPATFDRDGLPMLWECPK